MSALVVRPMRADDEPQVVELLRASLGEGQIPRTAAFWRWKHQRSPFGASPVLVAEEDGALLGVRAFLRWRFGDVRAVRAVDTATAPSAQGRGIFKTLTLRLVEQLQRDGAAFVFNTPNDKSGPGYLKLGWRRVGQVPVWTRVGSPLAWAGSADADAWAREEQPLEELRAHLARAPLPERDARLQTDRTHAYLAWRYAEIPGIRYAAEGDERATVVYRRRVRRGLRELTLVEVLARGARGVLRAARLIHSLAWRSGAQVLSACAPARSDEGRALALAGMVPVPRVGPLLVARPLVADPPHGLRGWRLSAGDLELF